MIENLTQLFVARAAERPDLRVGTIEEQLTLPDALRRAAGGAPDPVDDHQSGTGDRPDVGRVRHLTDKAVPYSQATRVPRPD